MGSEHYCLRWNNHQSNLLGVFSQLLESESLVDVTLACTEGPSIRAHKVVLSACSSYFQALFLDHPNRHPIVILKDVRFAELRTLVDFMYKGEVNVEYCQLSALLKTAESLKVKGLADMTNINAAAVQASRDEQQQQQQSSHSEQESTSATTTTSSTSTTSMTTTTTAATVTAATTNSTAAAEPMLQDGQDERYRSSENNSTGSNAKDNGSTSCRDSRNNDKDRDCRDRDRDRDRDREKREEREIKRESTSREKELLLLAVATQQQQQQQLLQHQHSQNNSENDECSADDVEIAECPPSPQTRPRSSSPCPGPLALDRPRSRRDSDSAASLEETRAGSLSPLSVHSGPSDMSLSNNTGGGGAGVTPVTIPLGSLPQSRLPSPHSTEPLAGPSGLPPVQQVPLSLKKEVDWERSTEERSASSEMSSSDYRLPPDPVSLALGLEPAGWGGLSPGELVGSEAGSALLSSAGFAAGLAGLARRCGVCLASFPSTWLLERHAILQHAGQPSDDKPFTCEQCGQRYRYRSAYVKHREQNHRARLPADKLFTCDVCGMQFRYLKSFKKHRLNHALERLQRGPSSESQALTERSDQVSSTGEPSLLETGSAGDASPLQVDVDDQPPQRDSPTETREEAASSETASVQESPNDLTAETLHAAEIAERSSSAARNAAGSDAEDAAMDDDRIEPTDATTTTSSSLNLTVNRGHHHHHDADRRERRFACPFCGKCVRSKENLKLHVRKHTGERPFVCLFCGRAFGGKSDLTRHLRIHTGERPYHCEMCGKCFARADYLSKHLTTHIHQR